MLTTTTTALLTLPLLTTAHFTLRFPTQRGAADTESSEIAPCGGLPVSSTRTSVSLTSFPLALEMGHDESVVQVLLSLSSNPESEDAFNVTLERTFGQTGLGDFCLPDVMVPEGVKEGDIGTVQVVTDGEGGGGLYACADVIFTSTNPATPSSCKNGTGVTASALSENINANESTAEGQPQSGGGDASSSGTSSSSAAAASGTGNAAATLERASVAGWGVLGLGVLGGVALL